VYMAFLCIAKGDDKPQLNTGAYMRVIDGCVCVCVGGCVLAGIVCTACTAKMKWLIHLQVDLRAHICIGVVQVDISKSCARAA